MNCFISVSSVSLCEANFLNNAAIGRSKKSEGRSGRVGFLGVEERLDQVAGAVLVLGGHKQDVKLILAPHPVGGGVLEGRAFDVGDHLDGEAVALQKRKGQAGALKVVAIHRGPVDRSHSLDYIRSGGGGTSR